MFADLVQQAIDNTPGDTKKKTTQGILLPLLTFATVGFFSFLSFCVSRRIFHDIYAPRRILRRGRPPKIPRGFLTWIPIVFRTQEAFLVSTVGVDGVMLLRFFKFGYRLFGLLSILCLGVLGPINFYSNPPKLDNVTGYYLEDVFLSAISVMNVPHQSPFLKVHLLFTWLISLITIAFLISFYRNFVALKLQYEEYCLRRTEMSKIELRSVMVFGIPLELRNEIDLATYFKTLGIGKVENVVLCRNWSLLQRAVANRAHYLKLLESVYIQCQKPAFRLFSSSSSTYRRGEYLLSGHTRSPSDQSPFLQRRSLYEGEDVIVQEILSRLDLADPQQRPSHRTGFMGLFGPKVDSALFYANKFSEWDQEVNRLRRQPEQSSATPVAFVTFESPESAALASQCILHRRPFSLMTKPAPEPRDIYWPNLSARGAQNYTKVVRSIFVLSSMFILVFSSTFIVSSIAGLIDLEQLAVVFPVFGSILKDLPVGWVQFIQGVIPAILLATWTSSLPSVLLILCQGQGLETISWIETSLLSKYFFYQLWNVLFVTVFARTLIYDILQNPASIIETLGQMLPKSSTTITNYVILQGTAILPAQLLLAGPLILTWMSRFISFTKSTPREVSDAYYPSILTCINYGIVYPVPLLMFVIGLTYAPIAPVILPFCTLFFAIGYFVYKYMLMYVHVPRFESRGSFASVVANRCLAGLVIMQMTMMGVLALRAGDAKKGDPNLSGYAQMVLGVFPLVGITLFVFQLLSQGYEKQLRNIPLDILGAVARDLEAKREVTEEPRQPQFHGQELAEFKPGEHPTLHHRTSTISMLGRHRYSDIVTGEPQFQIPVKPPPESPGRSIHTNRYSSPIALFADDQDPEPFSEDDPRTPGEQESLLESSSLSDFEEALALANHLEPPMTRVPGILDAPLGAALLRYGDMDYNAFDPSDDPMADDLQIHTFMHPALIGKLPIAWLPGMHDAPRLAALRESQTQRQRAIWERLVQKQQLSVDETQEFVLDQPTEPVGRIRGFLDGLLSWMQLSLS
ncbi:hypothetical protein EDD86DRAFT_192935 [Gorgonomyces haynaldii]|nr:hypothetical protein EDD86DRAFT_192935 [Gorgonomyces haynaldii]